MVIYEKEASYAKELSGYLSRHSKFPYRIATFTGEDTLCEFLKDERPDIILLGEDCNIPNVPLGTKVIRLIEEKGLDAKEPWIFKYQSAGNIMREVAAFSGKGICRSETKKGPCFYTVFSPKAGNERTEYARGLARDLRKDGTVIYVNMDPFPAEEMYSDDEWNGMSEAIYYLKNGGEGLFWKMKGLLVERDGIKEIAPVHCSMDLLEMNSQDVKLLFETLAEMPGVSNVVVDLGFYNEAALDIFSCSDSIHLVSPLGIANELSTEYFIKQLKVMQREYLEGRIEIINYGRTKPEIRNKGIASPKVRLLAGME